MYNLSVSLLDPLKVLLRLLKLVFSIIDQDFCALDFTFDLLHDGGNDVDLVGIQVLLVDAGGAKEGGLELVELGLLDLDYHV